MAIPQTTKAWTVEGLKGFGDLKYHEALPVPPLGDHEALVKSMPHPLITRRPASF